MKKKATDILPSTVTQTRQRSPNKNSIDKKETKQAVTMEGTQKITPKLVSEKITETEMPQACQNHKKAQLKENIFEYRKEIETVEMEPSKRKKAVRKQREHKQ